MIDKCNQAFQEDVREILLELESARLELNERRDDPEPVALMEPVPKNSNWLSSCAVSTGLKTQSSHRALNDVITFFTSSSAVITMIGTPDVARN